MKTLTILLVMALFVVHANAQSVKEYKASNGISYKVGDTVRLGIGSAGNGAFSCMYLSGWNAAMGYDQNGAASQFNIGPAYANKQMIIQGIDWENVKGTKRYYFIVGDDGNNDYNLYIDAAVKNHEVMPFNTSTAVAVKQ